MAPSNPTIIRPPRGTNATSQAVAGTITAAGENSGLNFQGFFDGP